MAHGHLAAYIARQQPRLHSTVAQENAPMSIEPERADATDWPYTFGRPASLYLSPREIVRLTILRSRLREHTASDAQQAGGFSPLD
jgi:hypothetical protein